MSKKLGRCEAWVKDHKLICERRCRRDAVGRFGRAKEELCTQHARSDWHRLRRALDVLEADCRRAGVRVD